MTVFLTPFFSTFFLFLPMSDEAFTTVNGVEITRPAKHGLSLEWSPAPGQRVVVRVFAFEEGTVAGTKVDVPLAVDEVTVLELLVKTCMRMGASFSQEGAGDLEGAEDPLAVPVGDLLPPADAVLRKIYESLRVVLLEARGYANALVRAVCEEDKDEAERALLRDLDMCVQCVRGLERGNGTNLEVRATQGGAA